MRIQDMFERDIDRNINGVIKVSQDDTANVDQELEEYVVTNELRNHFSTFFEAYDRALDAPTDKIGVWISGFFGSGKSHFLKMLHYLLTNQKHSDGRAAIDILEPRFEDGMIAARARRATEVPTEAILFNIDSKGPAKKDKTAVMRVFARVFYEQQGFYGSDLKLARLERYVESKGLTSAFRKAYEDITDVSWVEDRQNYVFHEDELAEALATAGVMSEDAAIRWAEGSEEVEFSIEQLTDEIRDYAEKRATENGGQFRLLFMIDEMSQYIANDVNLLLNLQTIVEEIGTKCAGRVWVIVTGQEAIDEITKVAGDDFSKIVGRFNTRLSLSSSGAGEVIRKRVLAKDADATNLLQEQYSQNASVLKNLYSFGDRVPKELGGYEDAPDFASAFPFVSYQFPLMQKIINELRKQGSSGKHLSAERSMLSGFQEAAQRIEERDENALVPLWRFYDTVEDFLESHHRRVIENCAAAAKSGKGLEEFDTSVLKLLFLLRWVSSDMPSNLENITILMTDDIRVDRAELRKNVQESLDRLKHENYIEQSGEQYRFLTDDEQEIAQAIDRTKVEIASLTKEAANIVFGDILIDKKLELGKNNFPLTTILDKTTYAANGDGITLRVIAGIDGTPTPSHEDLVMESSKGQAIVLLDDGVAYYDCLANAAKIEQYLKTINRQNLPESQQQILRNKQREKTELTKQARGLFEQAVLQGQFYVQGNSITRPQSSSAKKVMEECAAHLVSTVYQKLSYIDKNYDSDADIKQILNNPTLMSDPGTVANARAAQEIDYYLQNLETKHHAPSMQEVQEHFQKVPYGWREIDIAACVAQLLCNKHVKLEYAGKTVDPQDATVLELLRKAKQAEKTTVLPRHAVDPAMLSVARQTIERFTGTTTLPVEEDSLAEAIRECLAKKYETLTNLLSGEYKRNPKYPGFNEVTDAKNLVKELLDAGSDAENLITAVSKKRGELEDATEDLHDVSDFFPNQQKIFDRANDLRQSLKDDQNYLASDEAATHAFGVIDSYLSNSRLGRPYQELGNANQALAQAHDTLLKAKRDELLAQLDSVYEDIEGFAKSKNVAPAKIGQTKIERRNAIGSATTLTKLDAIKAMLDTDQTNLYSDIEHEYERRNRPRPIVTTTTTQRGEQQPTPAPEPKKSIKDVNRMLTFPPKTLNNEEEIDEYLRAARAKLMSSLNGNDAIKIN